MKHLTLMLKPASSLCNMRCTYCFYHDVAALRSNASFGFMNKEVAKKIIENTFCELISGDHITFAFQGGEPSLAGLDFFLYFIAHVKKTVPAGVKVHYAFQTNGLMITEDWCRFFKLHKFLIGLSLDGDAALHNRNRIDKQCKGTFSRVMKTKKLLEQFNVDYNVLCVLTSESARRANRIWDFILRENISYVQFIPCLQPLEDCAPAALSSERFYRFYSELFRLWKVEIAKGNMIVVKLFEDLAVSLLTGHPLSCSLSGRCTPQFVVEADGAVYPCDFYVLDKYKIGDLSKNSIKTIFDDLVISSFYAIYQENLHCDGCRYSSWCHGGCKRMSVYGEACGMRLFLDECLDDLLLHYRRYIMGYN